MIDAVLFDLADTLVNFHDLKLTTTLAEGARDTYKHLQNLAVALPEFTRYRNAHLWAFKRRYLWSAMRRRDFTFMDVIIQVLGRFSIDLPIGEYETLAWLWYRPFTRRAYVDAGVAWALDQLKALGIKLAVVSNTCVPAHCMDQHLQRENLLQYFPIRIYSSMTLYRKPHRRIFDTALQQLNVAPEKAAFVGDRLQTDIRGARRLGMLTIWKPTAQWTSSLRLHCADHVIRRIADLPHILTELRTAG